MRVMIIVLVLGACATEPATGQTSQSSTTCVSDPIVVTEEGPAVDIVPRCQHYYTLDYASSDIVFRADSIVGYHVGMPWFDLNCWETDSGWSCHYESNFTGLILTCDYSDNGITVCYGPPWQP